ncbi:hypothetical protein IG631_11088 [Alternaria alternata]|nr:hypothetical protein IG631_11088 [Alternaria alternata]
MYSGLVFCIANESKVLRYRGGQAAGCLDTFAARPKFIQVARKIARHHHRKHHLDLGSLPFSDQFVRTNIVQPVALRQPKNHLQLDCATILMSPAHHAEELPHAEACLQ